MSDSIEQVARELKTLRELVSSIAYALREAEAEVPEKMRRFVMYWHDLHDIANLYHENGQVPPGYVLREMERCDDRFRQLLTEAHTDGGAFEKIRRDMAADPLNRWDHTRLLTKPKE